MRRLSPSAFTLGATIVAGPGIGAGFGGVVTGSMILLVIAVLCAVVCGLLQAIAFQRAIGDRIDALIASIQPSGAPSNNSGGGL
ncbi:hypothetical protein ACSD7O_22345 [Methylorubrum extorquens]|uniref:hypothetical protein n=1 Tax=Methylorubrum extorquens TaxID=408 RepID=UPI003F61BC7D